MTPAYLHATLCLPAAAAEHSDQLAASTGRCTVYQQHDRLAYQVRQYGTSSSGQEVFSTACHWTRGAASRHTKFTNQPITLASVVGRRFESAIGVSILAAYKFAPKSVKFYRHNQLRKRRIAAAVKIKTDGA